MSGIISYFQVFINDLPTYDMKLNWNYEADFKEIIKFI
jgi:hypothetical protein